MCKKSIYLVIFILVLSLISGTVQAELKVVENFELLRGITTDGTSPGDSPDDQACTGVLGGMLDSEIERTGSVDLVTETNSRCVTHMSHSNGVEGRAVGFNGITNPIDNDESGIAFCRFKARLSNYVVRTFIGLITDTSDDPVDTNSTDNPMSCPAGIFFVSNDSGQIELFTLDKETVLMADVAIQQWYSIWIVAHHKTDTFDLYMREADAPDEEVTLPTPEDLIAMKIPFTMETTDPFTGMIFSSPGGDGPEDRTERIWVDEIWWDGDQGLEAPTKAKKPQPENNAVDVAQDVVLSWRSAPGAAAHDVYFGENAEDVNLATVDDPRGVLASPAQDANTYEPETLLELGKTYYWRVDEVNDLDTDSPYVGKVWEFEVEPVGFDLTPADITVTASGSADGQQVPENTINNSGLDVNDLHGTDSNTMWLSNEDPAGAWIEFAFGRSYMMHEMRVWNHNTGAGLDMKDVVVSTKTDGADWTPVTDVNKLTQAPGLEGYQANTIIDMNGVVASHIRIAASSNWGGSVNQFGLSEVRFSVIPTEARLPQPESGAVAVNPTPEVSLSWRRGRVAAQHVLYLSDNEQAVIDGTVPSVTLTDAEYPIVNLDVNSVYYWRVDQVNGTEVWPGEVWNFSTVETLSVDDFERYTNDPPFMVFQTWVDGLGINGDDWVPPIPSIPGNGTRAVVGYDIWGVSSPHYKQDIMHRNNPHGGFQCMPLNYRNAESTYVSEAIRTFDSAMDWTKNGVDSLGIWYRGSSSVDSFSYDSGTQTYSVIAGGGNIAPAGYSADTFHYVYKPLNGNGEMVVKVESLDEVHAWSKAGIMIRQGLETGGKHAFIGITPQSGVTFAWRKVANGNSDATDVAGSPVPYWLKLVRSGFTISSFRSPDGSAWESIASASMFLSGDIYIGMAVSSHESRTSPLCEAVFSNVSTSGGVAAGVFTESASVSWEALNTPERLYVAISDAAGNREEVELDATGTGANGWTLGTVNLASIPGSVNIGSIKKMAIGVGDGAPGSDGLVLIDDVCLLSTD